MAHLAEGQTQVSSSVSTRFLLNKSKQYKRKISVYLEQGKNNKSLVRLEQSAHLEAGVLAILRSIALHTHIYTKLSKININKNSNTHTESVHTMHYAIPIKPVKHIHTGVNL